MSEPSASAAKPSESMSVGIWAALVLRVAISSLFLAAAVPKFQTGVDQSALQMSAAFQETWLPSFAVEPFAYATPFIEVALVVWLLIGFRVMAAWIAAAFFMTALAFGMLVLRETQIAAMNYNYVLICVFGIYFSRYDFISLDGLLMRRAADAASHQGDGVA